MKIGYLHISTSKERESGITRYSRLLASEAHQRSNLSIMEANVILTENKKHNQILLGKAAKELDRTDIIHLHYSKYLWGGGWKQLFYLKSFISQCSVPIVATFHDMYPAIYPSNNLLTAFNQQYQQQVRSQSHPLKRVVNAARGTWYSYLADRKTLLWLSKQLRGILISTEEEKQRIIHLIDPKKLTKIPLFVEEPAFKISRLEARSSLGLEDYKVVTLQGFIYDNKGHQLLIEAIPKLPPEVKVIFAGGIAPNNQGLLSYLLKIAEKKGVAQRLHITGYLSEEDLLRYLVASDLAVCPFKLFSASASLSTWISVARPILASDLPQIAEYNQIEPGAIHTFNPYTAEELAKAILKLLPICSDQEDPAVVRLQKKLSMSIIFNDHLKFYQDAAKKEKSS
ncbi:glycosyltransferase [Limnofasciculus baicalensis]|uniref:Glycosyltransferase n=1 Tax=Limnofasciculus baicalensis BBK-W-15 TaxID=2699891 RepID=A0AAE3GR32_9CYAN|nr:glycosyltransferase [Limnofasciculus baicalensis]MCP2728303.1 glycosyltransferase [Limnofasciculus baicalensis BBK-W-15]